MRKTLIVTNDIKRNLMKRIILISILSLTGFVFGTKKIASEKESCLIEKKIVLYLQFHYLIIDASRIKS